MSDAFPDLLQQIGFESHTLLCVLICLWQAVLFLQSGLDKLLDYSGNAAWLKAHFEQSPLKGTVGVLLPVITLSETAAGLFSAIGVVQLLGGGSGTWAFWGLLFAALSLLALFFGQRVAKDYAGAATLVPYFILVVFGLFLLS